ncbi:MAG: Hpt domain-containing protein [Pseudomonadota bacterium]|mgnify:CR=1 FL=1
MTEMPTAFDGQELSLEFAQRAARGLVQLEDMLAAATPASLAEFRREAHSLKGNAQVYGLTDFANLCHGLEDALPDGTDWTKPSETQAAMYLAHMDVVLRRLEAGLA